MFGGYVAYGIATHVGKEPHASLHGWQIIFLLFRLLTALVGIAFFFVLPNSPLTAGFLSHEQKSLRAEHLRGNEQGIVLVFQLSLLNYSRKGAIYRPKGPNSTSFYPLLSVTHTLLVSLCFVSTEPSSTY
jgi:hypothetical protein